MSNNVQMWSLIAAFFVPPLLAILQQPRFSATTRAVLSFLAAVVVGGGVVYFEGNLSWDNKDTLVSSVLLVLVTSIATYHGFWKPTGVAPAVEEKTSPAA